MRTKSSRFSRMAYARRAASLADELADWHQIYARRSQTASPWAYNSSQRAAITDRAMELQRMVIELQNIASALVALR